MKHFHEWVAHEYYTLIPETEWNASSTSNGGCQRVVEFWSSDQTPPGIPNTGSKSPDLSCKYGSNGSVETDWDGFSGLEEDV